MTQANQHILDMDKPGTDHILRLPVEVLEYITSFYDPSIDSLALRLSCRTLAGTALRSFAEYHLARLSCSMLDHGRLLRIERLLKQSYLFERVRTFLMTTMEENLTTHQDKHNGSLARISDDNVDHCHCGTGKVSPESWALIEKIIKRLGNHTNASLRLDFAWERYSVIGFRAAPQASTLLRAVLKLARSATVAVSGLCLSDRFEVDYSDVLPLGNDYLLLQHLDRFDYTLKPYGAEEDLQSHNDLQQREIVRTVNNHARGLKHFAKCLNPWCGPTNEAVLSLSKE